MKTMIFLLASLAAIVPASAHITFENKDVTAGSTVKFVLRVPHGCAGSATTAVRIALPPELASAQPQPKAGWELAVTKDEAHNAGGGHGHSASVREVAWTGGKLEDAFYDEFVFRATVAKDAKETLYLPIVQECETGVERWIEIPTSGQSSGSLKSPAPFVRVQPSS